MANNVYIYSQNINIILTKSLEIEPMILKAF
jgi:hypothetical protein